MTDSIIVYTALAFGFVFLVAYIKFFPFIKNPGEKKVLMYYKMDFLQRKISTITPAVFGTDTKTLSDNKFNLIFLSDLETLAGNATKLPHNYYLIVFTEAYEEPLQKAIPPLAENNVSIIIFLPVLISSETKKDYKNKTGYLNNFIYSDAVKKYFDYAQPNGTAPATS